MTKYRAIRTNGYSSKRESARAQELKLLERAGLISNLREQVPYILAPSVILDGRKKPAVKYVCDFVYIEDGREILEDVKGMSTPVYRLKKHLMKSVLNLDIKET